MPITKSAKKALRVSKRRHTINLRVKRAYKGAVKDVRKTATHVTTEARKKDETQKKRTKTAITEAQKKNEARKNTLSKAYSELDKAAKKGIIHKNKASRLKSRLAKLTKS